MTDQSMRRATKAVFHDMKPQVSTDKERTWITRGGNFAVCYSEVKAGAVLERKDNPEDDYNTTTTNTFGVGYGVGIAYWISRHWNFSMSVTNPLVSYSQSKRQIGPNMNAKSSDTTIGLVFSPGVFMMIHLYN